MDDLFVLNDIPPQYQQRTLSTHLAPATQQEINDFFTHHYAGGLDRLLETDWYGLNGLVYMNHDPTLQDFVVQCVERFKVRHDDPTNANRPIPSLEARLVWQLACMPRRALDPSIPTSLLHRLDIVEHLLTGGFLDARTLAAPPPTAGPKEQLYEQLYWYDLGRFTAARDDGSDTGAQEEIDDTLGRLRGYLGRLENRDVLYSIAIVRHIGGRMPDFHPQKHLVATSNDADDDTNKLKVAQTHVQNEDQRGLTQVIQRICGMAIRGWHLQKS
nr:hypothetical protein CFP56_01192 [Quercus suber]